MSAPTIPLSDEDRAARVEAIGKIVYGDRWQSALARDLGVSHALMNAIALGQRRVTPGLEKRLLKVVKTRLLPDMRTAKDSIAAIADGIDAEYGL